MDPSTLELPKIDLSNSGIDLNTILGDSDPLAQQLKRNETMTNTLEDAGVAPELTEPRESAFSKVFNFIDKPKQVTLGLLDSAFLRKDLFDVGLPGVINRSLDERTNAFDILRREGVENPIVRGTLGLATEIVTNPLNWISFGAGTAAKVGGEAVSETGQALAKQAVDSLIAKGVELPEAHNMVAQAFEHLGSYKDSLSEIARLNASKNRLSNVFAIDALQGKADTAFKAFKDLLPGAEDTLDTLFAKNKLNLGITLPFLGHLTGQDLVPLANSEGIFKKSLTAVSNVLNPGRLEIGSFDLPELSSSMLAHLDDAKAMAAKQLTNLNNTLEGVPVLGAVVQKGNKIVKKSIEVGDRLIEGVKDIFFHTAGLNVGSKNAALDYINEKAAARTIGQSFAYKTLGPFVENIKNMHPEEYTGLLDDFTDAGIALDLHAGQTILDQAIQDPAMRSEFYSKLLDISLNDTGKEGYFNTAVRDLLAGEASGGVNLLNADWDKMGMDSLGYFLEQNAQSGYKALSQRGTDVLLSLKKGMGELFDREKMAGIETPFIENYLTHIVENMSQAPGLKSSVTKGFLKARKYDTFNDLLRETGLTAKTNIVEILTKRAANSYLAIANKNLWDRLVMHNGLRPEDYYALYKDAVMNPHSASALAGAGFDLPSGEVVEKAKDALDMLTRSARISAPSQEVMASKLFGKWDIGEKESVNLFKLLSPVETDLHNKARAVGLIPQDLNVPLRFLGESAQRIKINGEELVVPTKIADFYKEVTSNRDLLKDAVAGNKLLEPLVKWGDTAMSTMKRWTLWPFPSFWAQNAIGNTLFNMADQGGNILRVSNFVEAHNIALGKGFLETPNGRIAATDITRAMKQAGFNTKAEDYMGVIQAAADFDVDKMAKQARGPISNLKRLELGTIANKAIQKLQFGFEDMFRFNQVVYELKKGSLLPDALRNANDVMLNFRNLSRVEQSLFRRFYMFYPWIKASSVKTLNQMIFNPGFISNQIKIARGVSEMFSEPDALPTVDDVDRKYLNDVISNEQIGFTIGKDNEGKPVTGTGFGLPLNTMLQQFTVALPRNGDFGELLNTVEYNLTRNLQKQFAASNPFIKGVVEKLLTKKDLYFNQPLSREFLHTLPSFEKLAERLAPHSYLNVPGELLDKAAMKFLDGVDNGKGGIAVNPLKYYMMINYIPGLSRAISTARRFSDEDLPIPTALVHFLTGIRVRPTNAQLMRAYEVGDNLQEQLENYNAKTRLKYGNIIGSD